MRKLFCTYISMILCLGLAASRQVPAIDSDSYNPYSTGAETGPGGSRGGEMIAGGMDLPLMTIVGAGLLVPGILAAVFWRVREARRNESA